jgi:hypothetical protein
MAHMRQSRPIQAEAFGIESLNSLNLFALGSDGLNDGVLGQLGQDEPASG